MWCEQLYIVPKSKECLGEILLLEAAAAAKSLQSCPTLCDPMDGSPPGSSVPGILQQEHWSGLPFPSPMHACILSHFSCAQLCAILQTAAHPC